MVCLDTDVIIDYLKKKESATRFIRNLQQQETSLTTTTITSFELFKGIFRLSDEDEKKAVEIFLTTLTLLYFTFEASVVAARISEELRKKGEEIDTLDLQIAAICISKGESLLTRNAKHFERIPGLKLEPLA